MSVLVIGDVGAKDGVFHAGDEAMLETALAELGRRGIDSVVVSAEPAESTERYGVPAVARAGFGAERTSNRVQREARLEAMIAAARGQAGALEWQDPGVALIDAVAASDAVVIAGGGNLSSLWPEHLYERAALAAVARQFGKPVIVTGQTLGPALSGRDGEILAGMLGTASLVGAREAASLQVARQLGVPAGVLRHTMDDATLLDQAASPLDGHPPYLVTTFAPHGVDAKLFDELIAGALDAAAALTGLDVVMLPHVGSITGAIEGDQRKHAAIRARMSTPNVTELGVLTSQEIAAITRGAALSISSRYHPVVFAATGCVPAIAVTTDEYTSTKINGAFENVGLGRPAVAMAGLAAGILDDVVGHVWQQRGEISQHLQQLLPGIRTEASAWWDDVAKAVRGEPVAVRRFRARPILAIPEPLRARLDALDRLQGAEQAAVTHLRLSDEEQRLEVAAERERVIELEREIGASQAAADALEIGLANTEKALIAARALAAEVAEPLFARRLGRERVASPQTELQALLNTRTFRWTRGPRAVYGFMRKAALRIFRGHG